MVFFCPDCLYILGINKSTTLENSEDERKKIGSVNDLLKLVEKKIDDFSDYKAEFPKKRFNKK